MKRICECFDEYYQHEENVENMGFETDEECNQLMADTTFWKPKCFHAESKSLTKKAWDVVCEIFDDAEQKNTAEIDLAKLMDKEDYCALNTLPETIGNLKALRKLTIYGSSISYIPREISGCENLREFVPYQSHRLHWFPYEIKQCQNLIRSTISTRALYGNYKTRNPFPSLKQAKWVWNSDNDSCSICGKISETLQQHWISERIATDVVPLLVSVCGIDCLSKVGDYVVENYIPYPHQGGLTVLQPPTHF